MPSKILAIFKIYPEDDKVDLESLKSKLKEVLPKDVYINKIIEEELAFGIKVLRVFVIMPLFFEGGTQPLEDAFSKVKGVSQVDVELVQTL
ncbi:MAG: elongation factor 1-beta [Candidatus Verstraetearchaeota archaeon]|jgi:elongation factor 1-beta|nr:elongation factor 1-beta [Candidatus Verstraetearchaeota archaeon]